MDFYAGNRKVRDFPRRFEHRLRGFGRQSQNDMRDRLDSPPRQRFDTAFEVIEGMAAVM